ncbi:hypothetical protein HCU40_15130 [Pseudanabaena biceps]|nr:hypothetical protein [Pseudanabaena biceps]
MPAFTFTFNKDERKADASIFAGRPSVRFTIMTKAAVPQDAVSKYIQRFALN